jgi:hypothetical protein
VVYHEHILLDCDVSFKASNHLSLARARQDFIFLEQKGRGAQKKEVGSRKLPQL